MNVPALTAGSVGEMMMGVKVDEAVIQILSFKSVNTGGNERFRLLISDGKYSNSLAMLATQHNHMVASGELETNSIIRVDKYMCNTVATERKVVVILNLTILVKGSAVGRKIGNPVPFDLSTVQKNTGNESRINNPPLSSSGLMNEFAKSESNSAGQQYHQPQLGMKRPAPSPVNTFRMNNNNNNTGYGQENGEKQISPIASLTPYQNRWTIRVRVTNRSAIRTWSNARGEGKLFSMDLVDDSGEIRATAFNDQCDKYYDMVQVGQVYFITRGQIKTANKAFTSIKNEYEMTLNQDTQLEPCNDDVSDVPTVQYSFVPINQLPNKDKNCLVDIIGVCKSCGDIQSLVSRTTNKDLKKRDIVLVDQSNADITLTMWGNEAETFTGSANSVVAIKGARLTDFGGCSLSLVSSSMLHVNPDMNEAFEVRSWYDLEGANQVSQSLSKSGGPGTITWKNIEDIRLDQLGSGDKPDYFSVKATIVFMKADGALYMACPGENCNKKVVDLSNGQYRCEKCSREYDSFNWRIIMNGSIADHTDNVWVSAFQETAEVILGVNAQQLGDMMIQNREQGEAIFSNANFQQFIFKLRTKQEFFNDERRQKTSVVNIQRMDFKSYSRKLIADIKQMMKEKQV